MMALSGSQEIHERLNLIDHERFTPVVYLNLSLERVSYKPRQCHHLSGLYYRNWQLEHRQAVFDL